MVTAYSRMRTDAQIASLLLAFTLPIGRYRWSIRPNGARDEVVEDVARNLSLPIEGQDDDAPTGRWRDRFSHDRHPFPALLNLNYGFMFFESVYRYDGQTRRHRIRTFAARMRRCRPLRPVPAVLGIALRTQPAPAPVVVRPRIGRARALGRAVLAASGSGRPRCRYPIQELAAGRPAMPVLVVHGEQDPVAPVSDAPFRRPRATAGHADDLSR